MTDNLLYFPYINVPKTTWTTISVLYWDSVGAIVPDLYKDRPNRLEQNMRQMVESGLVHQVFPYEYVYNIPNFDHAFLELTQRPDFNLGTKQHNFEHGRLSRLHVQKFSEELLRELEQMRLVRRENWEWYFVEEQTARLFMTYLATVIAKAENYTPSTDSSRNIDLRLDIPRFPYQRQTTRNKFLNDLMPYPLVSGPYELRNFKERYDGELKRFRNRLEQIIIEVINIRNREERDLYYQLKLKEILQQRDEIYARMSETPGFGQVLFGTIFGLTSAILGFNAGAPVAGTFAFGNAVFSAFQGYDRRNLLREDFAYLALIDKRFSR